MGKAARKLRLQAMEYEAFDQLNGSHPWKEQVPEGLILYPVRRLNQGRVSYFNFHLAKEMGLIGHDHPRRMNRKLEQKLLDTFCLRIINEYDQKKNIHFPSNTLKKNSYMATRYLQLQHVDKSGRTSGDGRCIWNGTCANGKKTWDISSRGTGVTALAPGVVEAGKPLRSGSTAFGYGCGMADMDELFGAALMAEIIHRNGHSTERVLAIIDLGKGLGIGVRAAPNLIRPAHLFLYLKQARHEPLRRAVDYFIERQNHNGDWNISLQRKDRFQIMVEKLCENFAKFTAYLDRDFIFAWLDWDGDNVLANGGIIDYGSVRQFGLRHDEYRYDDVDRFSTNLNEQKLKARLMIQNFVQMKDFLETGVKRPISEFKSDPILKVFDQRFHHHLMDRFLYQLGFDEGLRRILLNLHGSSVREFFQVQSEFERIKTHRKAQKVPDGIHRPAIFNMRSIMAKMPSYILENGATAMPAREFFDLILSSQALRRDRRFNGQHKKRIQLWQRKYLRLIKKVTTPHNIEKLLKGLKTRSEKVNREDRMTGNGLINVVDELLKFRKKGAGPAQIQALIDEFIDHQTLNPDFREPPSAPRGKGGGPAAKTPVPVSLLHTLLTVTYGYREDI
jgi:hypothetical protein